MKRSLSLCGVALLVLLPLTCVAAPVVTKAAGNRVHGSSNLVTEPDAGVEGRPAVAARASAGRRPDCRVHRRSGHGSRQLRCPRYGRGVR